MEKKKTIVGLVVLLLFISLEGFKLSRSSSSFIVRSTRLFKKMPKNSKSYNSGTKNGKETETNTSNKKKPKLIEDQDPLKEIIKPKVKNFATTTITGQTLINCRPFRLEGQKKFEFLGSFKDINKIPIYPIPEVAFLGRSNVGKSSLLNCLTGLNKNIAVESKTPGRTQCMNLFKCSDNDGDICIFVDLPGYGYAKISKTLQEEIAAFIRAYLVNRVPLKTAVLLIDPRREPQEADLIMAQLLEEIGLPFILVATKYDKLKPNEGEKALKSLSKAYHLPLETEINDPTQQFVPISFSSITGQGKKEVWKSIKAHLLSTGSNDDDDDDDDGLEDNIIIDKIDDSIYEEFM